MKLADSVLHHARSDAGRRAIRYVATSAFGVVTTQVFLVVFQYILHWKPIVAAVLAMSLTSVPAFLLNKHWVWGKKGKAHMRREVLPFWLFNAAGLILSLIAVTIVIHLTRDPNVESLKDGNRLAVQFATLAGFGILWVLKYLFLDKIMFGADHHTPYDEDIEREEAGLPPEPTPSSAQA